MLFIRLKDSKIILSSPSWVDAARKYGCSKNFLKLSDFDLLKYPDGTSGDLETSGVKYGGFDNARGFGLLFYIDAIPIVDLEVDIEFIGNVYKYTPYVSGVALPAEGEMPWGRVSTYLTARKEILALSVPLLAKAELGKISASITSPNPSPKV